MKKEYFSLSLLFIILSSGTFAHLKVDQYGRVGMGTNWSNPEYKCHIKGNLLLTTCPDNPFIELRFKVGQEFHGAEIETSFDKIAFWAKGVSYNDLYVSNYFKESDIKLISNIKRIKFGLERLMNYCQQNIECEYLYQQLCPYETPNILCYLKN